MNANEVTNLFDKFKFKVLSSERGVSQLKTDEKTGQQTGGNPMNVIDIELLDNPLAKVRNPDTGDKEEVDVNGVQVRAWITLTPKTIGSVNAFHKCIGLPPVSEATIQEDDGNLYVGKVGEALIQFNGRPIKNSEGEIIMQNGKPLTTSERKVSKWLMPA